jgi:hypothetical protein
MALPPARRYKDRRHFEEDAGQWAGKVVARYVAAGTADERMRVLAEMDRPLQLDEDSALALYRVEPVVSSAFIERHLPLGRRTDDQQAPWVRLMELSSARGDESLYFALYRRQASSEQWLRDTGQLARDDISPGALCAELTRRHPQRWRPDIGPHLIALARSRGEPVLPYLLQHVGQVWSRQRRGGYDEILELARSRGWWELWAALIRISAPPADYDREVYALATDRALPEADALHRLMLLAGVNSASGLDTARGKPLREDTILALHQRFAHLLRGPFRNQLQPSPRRPLTVVLELAIRVKDSELIDQLAARLAVRADRSGADQLLQAAAYTAQYLEAVDAESQAERRAVAIVKRIPRRAIRSQRELMLRNPLARLLFHRAARSCIQHADDAALLLQAEERHVRALAVDALTRGDPNARLRIGEHLDVLLHALELPLPRAAIRGALRMLEQGALDAGQAARVAHWAREKLAQRHPRFSQPALLSLVAHLLARVHSLRTPAEQPVIYRKAAA